MHLESRFAIKGFGNALIYRVLYAMSSGVTHSVQYALAAMMKEANKGKYNFVDEIRTYGNKAHEMKRIFVENGFNILYDKDIDQPISDGFYFTISYKGMKAGKLLHELLYYGVSGITLLSTGSREEGLRACVAPVNMNQFDDLNLRLKQFDADHNSGC